MATGPRDAPAQRIHSDCEQEQSAKRFKADPACLVAQAGSTKEFGEGIALQPVKQEPEELRRDCGAQWQQFPKAVRTPSSEWGPSGVQGQAGCFQASRERRQLRGGEIPPLLLVPTKKPQDTNLVLGKPVCKIVKVEFPQEIGREEVFPGEDSSSWDAELQKFREFRYYEAVGPRLTSVRLWTLCRQWLQPEKRTKQQILEQVILEQFLAILPREMQSWVRAHRPDNCPRAVALAESFLLAQAPKPQAALQKEAASIPKAEAPPSDSCEEPLSGEIKQEDDGSATPCGGTEREIKKEDPSQEDTLVESPAAAEGRAQGSLSSPRESGDPKEDPGTTCNPGDGTVKEIKEEVLSKEEPLPEAPQRDAGSAQQSGAFPSGSTSVRLPKEEPRATCNPGDGTVKEIKEEVLSEEESLPEAPERAAGSAQQSSAFPSGSALVRPPKEEPGTTCNPGDGAVKEIKAEVLSEEESFPEVPEMATGSAQQSGDFPSGSALVRLPKEELGTTHNPDSLSSVHGEMPTVKPEGEPGEPGEPEAQGLALGREEEVAGEREEVWTGYGKTFRWKSVLTPCKQAVTDWKIYQCCVCGKNYDAKSIRAHQKMHTGERLYECIYCGQTFSQRSHFDNHEKIHTGVKVRRRENLYICVTCGKSFAYYSTLVAHWRTHGEDGASMAD